MSECDDAVTDVKFTGWADSQLYFSSRLFMALSKLFRYRYRSTSSSTIFHCRRAYWNELLLPARGKSSHLEAKSSFIQRLLIERTDLWMTKLVSFEVEVTLTSKRMDEQPNQTVKRQPMQHNATSLTESSCAKPGLEQ